MAVGNMPMADLMNLMQESMSKLLHDKLENLLTNSDFLQHPNADPDRMILWKALFTKINTLMTEMEKVNQNLVVVKNRQTDQDSKINKLQEAADLNTKYLADSKERQEDQANQIIKFQEAADFNMKYMREVRLDSKERLEALEGKISKIMETAELTTKSLAEMRLESNKRQEDEGIQMTKLEENFNATSKVFDERQEEQGKQIIKLREAVDLTAKFVNETRSEFKKRQFDLMEKPYPQWTTILRRKDGSVDFYRNWTEYQKGFGNPPYGEFFIGLDRLHEMTTNDPHELMVVLRDWKNEERSAHYDLFEIGGEDDQYALNKLGTFSGNAGDSLEYNKDMKFSTMDRDNDYGNGNCARDWIGAWWFKSCSYSHLAGRYRKENEANQEGVKWYRWQNKIYSLKHAEMKVRPKAR